MTEDRFGELAIAESTLARVRYHPRPDHVWLENAIHHVLWKRLWIKRDTLKDNDFKQLFRWEMRQRIRGYWNNWFSIPNRRVMVDNPEIEMALVASDEPSPLDNAEQMELIDRINESLGLFEGLDRLILEATIRGSTQSEIAQELGVTRLVVKGRMTNKIRPKLIERLRGKI